MTSTASPTVRRFAAAGIIGALATFVSGVLVQAIVQPASDVSDEMWSYPWTTDALAPVSVVYAGFHFLVFLGMVGFARSGYAGTGRAARAGAGLAQIGTFVFFVAEFATIPFSDQRLEDPGPVVVGGLFGFGITLTAIGLIIAGVATLRSDPRRDWRRLVPLAAGLWSAVLIGISLTKALPTGVAIYGLTLLLLNTVIYTHSAPSAHRHGAPELRARVE